MFSSLIFTSIVLLLTLFILELNPALWSIPPGLAFLEFFLGYLLLLLSIFIMTKLCQRYFHGLKNKLVIPVNIFIISFLAAGQFFLGAHRVLNELPIISHFDSIKALFSAGLYLFALGFYHFVYQSFSNRRERFRQACQPIQLALPFMIPFFLIVLFLDLAELFSHQTFFMFSFSNGFSEFLLIFLILALLIALIIFLPLLMIRLWQCKPLEESPLKERLERLCQKANFRHAGMLIWTMMNNSLTAAIIGILPRFRVIIFSRPLLKNLSADSIEAVLAHEIGHSYHKHLVLFPFIAMGMPVTLGLFSLFFGEEISTWFNLRLQPFDDEFRVIAYSLTLFLMYAGILACYFRFIIGLFSRLFERQADLHVFQLGLDPQYMIAALDQIATATGTSPLTPNWHHYSLQQRIDFLKSCMINPKIIDKHHKRTRYTLIGYAFILFISINVLLAPLLFPLPIFL